jgi:hypothetical protein
VGVAEGVLTQVCSVCRRIGRHDGLGWTFRGRMEVEVQRRLPDGSIELDADEGSTTAWIVQP